MQKSDFQINQTMRMSVQNWKSRRKVKRKVRSSRKYHKMNPCKCNSCSPLDPNCCPTPMRYSVLPPCNFFTEQQASASCNENIFVSPMCNENFIEKKVKPCKDFLFCDNGGKLCHRRISQTESFTNILMPNISSYFHLFHFQFQSKHAWNTIHQTSEYKLVWNRSKKPSFNRLHEQTFICIQNSNLRSQFPNFLFIYSKLRCLAAELLNSHAVQLQVAAHKNHQNRSVLQSLNIFRSAQPAPNHTNQRRENRSAAAYTRRELPAKQPAMTGIRV